MFSPQISIHSISQFPPVTEDTTTENDAPSLSYGLGWGYIQCSDAGRAVLRKVMEVLAKLQYQLFIDKGISIIILVNSENGEKYFKEL
ncbi:MAG: hypothetical protein IPG18_08625 [Saprospiraceae bacterium]|nr:hypothetical protein [Saprospiraceae bacterium]